MDIEASHKSKYSICVSNNLKDYLLSIGAVLNKNFIFPCCADLNRFKDVVPNKSSDIVVGYFGGTSSWQCIRQVVNLVISLRRISCKYKLLLLCSGDLSAYSIELHQLGTENYTIKSLNSFEMPAAIASMDISVAFRSNRNLNIVSSPTKLSESLAAGVPLLVSRFCGDYHDIIQDGINGIVVNDIYITENDIGRIDAFCKTIKASRHIYFDICRNSIKNRTQTYYSNEFIKMIEN